MKHRAPIAALLMMLAAACSSAGDWRPYTTPDGRFTVEYPSAFQPIEATDTPTNALDAVAFADPFESDSFRVPEDDACIVGDEFALWLVELRTPRQSFDEFEASLDPVYNKISACEGAWASGSGPLITPEYFYGWALHLTIHDRDSGRSWSRRVYYIWIDPETTVVLGASGPSVVMEAQEEEVFRYLHSLEGG